MSVEPSREFEKILSQLQNSESVKQVERIVKTSDSESTYEYDIQVDQLTGKQKVVERFTSTKKECAICLGSFAKTFQCRYCKAQVCANDSRHQFFGDESVQFCLHCLETHFPWVLKEAEK